MIALPLLTNLSDDQLLAETRRLVANERAATAALLQSLMEIDSRRLYLREGCSSLFTYCTQVLHLAEEPPTTGSKRRAPRGDFHPCSLRWLTARSR